MEAKVRILLLITNLGRGGAQKVFHQQFHMLSQKYETTACAFNLDGAFPEERDKGIVSLDVPAGRTWIDKLLYFFLRIRKAKELKRRLKIDICISHLEGADYVNVLSGTGERQICWIHGTKRFDANIEGIVGAVRKMILIPWVYRRCSRLVTVSEEIRDELTEVLSIRRSITETIYNGFDLQRIRSQAATLPAHDLGSLKDLPLLVTHARLSRQKNLPGMLRVFSQLLAKQPARLIILGDGELREELISASEAMNLRTFSVWENKGWSDQYDVYFLGYHRNPFPYLSQAQLYIMTSDWEGFPLALCEAMTCGVPVVATDCPTGPREILSAGIAGDKRVSAPLNCAYGLLMPLIREHTEGIWVAALLKHLNSPEILKQHSTLGQQRSLEFDISNTTTRTIALIDRLAGIG